MTDTSQFVSEYDSEEALDRRGYYLFGVNQDEFVQVRDKKTDEILVIGSGRHDALRKATLILRKKAQP